jgi:hypothetical protein
MSHGPTVAAAPEVSGRGESRAFGLRSQGEMSAEAVLARRAADVVDEKARA